MKNFEVIGLFFLAIGLLMACNREQNVVENIDADVTEATELAYVEYLDDDIDQTVDETLLPPPPPGSGNGASCAEISTDVEPGNFPITITMDFGSGCEGKNGKIRSGKIIITLSDSLHHEGATRTTAFEDFFVDSVQISGTKTWENGGIDDDGLITIHKTAMLEVFFPDGTNSSWEHEHTIVKSTQFIRFKDQGKWKKRIIAFRGTVSLTGSSKGINRKGARFESNIIDPLVKPERCLWFVSGIEDITINGEIRIIDYGDGACNNAATVTLPDGSTREINIKPFWNRRK